MTTRPKTAGDPAQTGIDPAERPRTVEDQPKAGGTTPSLDSHPDQDGDQALRQIIRERLKTLGKSPGTAERIAGVPRGTIMNVLRGRSPTYEKLLQICDALHLRLTLKRLEVDDPPAPPAPAIPAELPPMRAPNNLATRATRRKAAKAEVLAAYYTSAPRGQIVERLRQIPEDVVAEVIDEMVNEEEYDDADELRSMAFQAGYKIW